MTIQECYSEIGGDFDQVAKRLPSVNLVKRFITKFLDDGSFSELDQAMKSGERERAFRASHTLKGVSANLSLGKLQDSSSELTELLRSAGDCIPEEAVVCMDKVKKDYELTVNTIQAYLKSND